MPAEKVEALRPKLEQAQKALEAALEEACDADVSDADSATLIRLEESLTVAREAARTAIGVLQRLRPEQQASRETYSEAHRVFVDENGVQWDVFAVQPSRATTGKRNPLPSPYQQGWLSIQCSEEIRRLAPIPEGWRELSRAELCKLIETAAKATPKKDRELKRNEAESRISS